MPFHFRYPTLADAEMLLRWRTSPEITRFMFTDFVPDLERQRLWLAACARRKDFRHFIICHNQQPAGYLSFADLDGQHRRGASGSYIAEPAVRQRLAGFLYPFIFDYAFARLGLHKLVNSFLAGNTRVLAVQRALRLREVGTLREHVWKNGVWHDVVLFELLRTEWEARPRLFPLAQTLAAFADAQDDMHNDDDSDNDGNDDHDEMDAAG